MDFKFLRDHEMVSIFQNIFKEEIENQLIASL